MGIYYDGIPGSLEEILKVCFGCEKPLSKNATVVGYDEYGNKIYNDITPAGWVAYSRLTTCIYALKFIGIPINAFEIIKELDSIISEHNHVEED